MILLELFHGTKSPYPPYNSLAIPFCVTALDAAVF